MKKDVNIKIRGVQGSLSDEPLEDEVVELETTGEQFEKHGHHYVVYEDFNLDEAEPVKTTVKIFDGKVDIKRFGTTKHHMTFVEGETHHSHYETPYGILDITVETEHIDIKHEEESLFLSIRYKLHVNAESMGNAFFEMACKNA